MTVSVSDAVAGRRPTPSGGRDAPAVPLCVDLDGTLVRTDTLAESVLAAVLRAPLGVVRALGVLLREGRAPFKAAIARLAAPDAAWLPYDEGVLARMTAARAAGRPVVLVTGADRTVADAVATHVGGQVGAFDAVLASDGTVNLTGARKAAALTARYGAGGFDYVGNSAADLPVWRAARGAVVVNAPAGVRRRARAQGNVLAEAPPPAAGVLASARRWLAALRVHHWSKNALVLLPVLLAHRAGEPALLLRAILAFLAFGACASALYLLNDLTDLEADRRHHRKRRRPLAAGTIPAAHGAVAGGLLLAGAGAVAWGVAPRFAAVLALYAVSTLAYSARLKQIPLVDVMMLAGLHTLRLIGGSAATDVPPSFWLLAFSMSLFMSLAVVKRHTELAGLRGLGDGAAAPRRGYRVEDLAVLSQLGVAAAYGAVLVLALYVHSDEARVLYARSEALWLLCPLLLYWVSRLWFLANRDRLPDDPIVFALTDRKSWLAAAIALAIVLVAR